MRVLACCDGSESADGALSWALKHFEGELGDGSSKVNFDDGVVIVYVIQQVEHKTHHDVDDRMKMEADNRAKEAVEKMAQIAKEMKVNHQVRIIHGDPPETICSIVDEDRIDCVVIGRRGMSRRERMLMGSISEYVVRNASCTVLIYKH